MNREDVVEIAILAVWVFGTASLVVSIAGVVGFVILWLIR